jgi:hypothetical protein
MESFEEAIKRSQSQGNRIALMSLGVAIMAASAPGVFALLISPVFIPLVPLTFKLSLYAAVMYQLRGMRSAHLRSLRI